jgi:oligopeptide/dipeptide ABC transporter ATP-binding protein
MILPEGNPLLVVEDLVTLYSTPEGPIRAVDGVSFSIRKGEIVCLVGESGSGKTALGLSLMRLIPSPYAHPKGRILFSGRDLLKLPEGELQRIRGNRIGMIFQEPMTSLNPVLKIGTQLIEPLIIHRRMSKRSAWEKGIQALREVGIPRPEQMMDRYPHELSGGMRQRVMIAMAMITHPDLVIADEPTTALDVSVEAQILNLLYRRVKELSASLLLITHDLGIVAEVADRVLVMYAGKIIEEGSYPGIFLRPRHPYTEGLLRSAFSPLEGKRFWGIPGAPPSPHHYPPGCRFLPRCPYAIPLCEGEIPWVRTEDGGVLCLRAGELELEGLKGAEGSSFWENIQS